MAVTAPTTRSDFAGFLTPEKAGPIFERAARISVAQRLIPQIPLGAEGKSIPVVTGRPTAGWVEEGGQKPATSGALSLKTITPKKLAAIVVTSAEVVRANPGGYVTSMREQLAEAFALAFDLAAFHDEGPDGTPGGGPFGTFLDQTTKAVEIGTASASDGGIHQDFVSALKLLVTDKDASGRPYRGTGFALDGVLEPSLWGAVDTQGQPVYVELPTADADALTGSGRLLNRPSYIGEGVASSNLTDVVGYLGDWNQARWGVVGGISFDVSTQATVTVNNQLMSLWEHNLVAIRAEAEYGLLVNDTDAFVKLTNANNVPVTSS